MPVLGLAGHVDHGKTSLVRALTGVDTDRLPEEKARGMTTDLGFAPLALRDPADGAGGAGGTEIHVGLVDVPGHERYIRNMAAGAWSLDLALLTVAADDGWMPQTETHARVLAAMGVPRVVVAVTKCDLAPAGRADAVGVEAVARAGRVLGDALVRGGAVRVSALSGEGIEELRAVLAAEITAIPRQPSPAASCGAFLCVDRVFTVRGVGTVVCGTLRGGSMARGDSLRLLPSGESLRIKAIECLGATVERAGPGTRVALSVSHAAQRPVRGDLLVVAGSGGPAPDSDTAFGMRFRRIPGSDDAPSAAGRGMVAAERLLSRGGEAEIAVGSAHRIVDVRPVGKTGILYVRAGSPLAIPRGLPVVLIRQGGADILGVCDVLFTGAPDREGRRAIAQAARRFAESARATRAVREEFDSLLAEASAGKGKAGSANGASGGVATALPREPGPKFRAAESSLARAGTAGVDIAPPVPGSRPGSPIGQAEMSELCVAGIAVPLGGTLFLHRDAYAFLVASILKGMGPGDSFDMGQAKSRTGFSRKFAIPFLNRMERDGYLRREGERRIVLRSARPAESLQPAESAPPARPGKPLR